MHDVFVNCPKKTLKGKVAQCKGECPNGVHPTDGSLDSQMGGWTSGEAAQGAQTNLAQLGPSGSSPLRSMVLVMARQEAGPH
jgi:hypothetical protein